MSAARNARRMAKRQSRGSWQPLVELGREQTVRPEEVVTETMRYHQIDRAEAVKRLDEYDARCRLYVNELYQVQTCACGDDFLQINVRRRDGAAIHDWRHLQRIKNEILGPECEAVELYPAESRLVDTTNKYHLWGSTDPAFRFPIGFDQRDVQDATDAKAAGLQQRRLA